MLLLRFYAAMFLHCWLCGVKINISDLNLARKTQVHRDLKEDDDFGER